MHFVKHTLILAMLVVLTGCGGSSSTAPSSGGGSETPAENPMVVTSVNTNTAIIGTLSTFVLSGSNMSSNMQVSLPNCQNISALSGSTSRVTFTCTPQAEGTQVLTVKTVAGASLFSSEIKFQTTAPVEDIIISSLEIPSVVTVGQIATFIIKGQNLPQTLRINLPQCSNLTQTSTTATQIVFTCTPQAAGTQTLLVSSENGDELGRRIVNVPPSLLGSWQQTASNGCTGTVGGETIIGARSIKPIFTFVRDSEKQVRLMDNEGLSYLSNDCSITASGNTATPPQFAVTTGISRFAAVYDNVSAAQTVDEVAYYSVNTTYSNNHPRTPAATAIVFKDPSTFCLFNGTVSPTNISAFIKNVDLTKAGCFARSSEVPFSQEKPPINFTTSISELVVRQEGELLINVLGRLNQRGQSGYVLIKDALRLNAEINKINQKSYDLLTQITGFPDITFSYQQQDDSALGVTERLNNLNTLGAQGYIFIGKKQLDSFFGMRATYVKINLPQTFSYLSRNDSDVDDTKLITILNEQGKQGCRLVDMSLQSGSTSTYTTFCVNSTRDDGTFSYRYLAYPESTRADTFKAFIDAQKKEGYYPIRALRLGSDTGFKLLFERNSSRTGEVQNMQYKVFSQTLPDNLAELNSLLNDQGKLGWHLWSAVNGASGQHLVTLFASLPFINLPDGEAVELDPR
ncbi:MAG: PT dipeptide repeat lipoprotein [Moraxellaceae bacterium]